jgi:hypothetical protein
MNNTTTKTRTLGILIVLVAAAAIITGTYAATITQSAFAGKKEKQQASDESPCSHLKAIKGGKIACASNEQKAKIDQQQSVNNDDDDKSKDANDKGRSYDGNDEGSSYDGNDEGSSDVTQNETASIYQDATATASIK